MSRALSRSRHAFRPDAAFWWRAAWAVAVLAAAGGVLVAGGGGAALAAGCLAAGGVPALIEMAFPRTRRSDAAATLAWTLGAGGAVLASGGALGSLGAWTLAPLAAGAAAGSSARVAMGGAGLFAILGFGLLASMLGGVPQVAPAFAPVLQAAGLVSTALGAAFGAAILVRRAEAGERAARSDLLRLARRLEAQPVLLLELSPEGRILAAHGPRPGGRALAGETLDILAAPESQAALAEALAAAAAQGDAVLGFAPAEDVAGWWEGRLRRGPDGRLAAALIDGAARRAREAELEAARAEAEAQNAGKSRFLANMSHELRTPLNAIMGFSDIMRAGLFGPLPDRYKEYAELIHESGRHLLDLINDVLDMSKIEAERFELSREDFDAREAVNAVLRLMRGQADRAGVQLRGVLPRAPLEVTADRRALKQIALNLISNALKFTPRDGSVTVALLAAGGQMELVVADTGAGMSAEDLARIGRPYEQAGDAERRAAGTGLGLSLVRSFAELHGGEMFIESAVGEGTTVTVRMPVLAAQAPEPALSAQPGE